MHQLHVTAKEVLESGVLEGAWICDIDRIDIIE